MASQRELYSGKSRLGVDSRHRVDIHAPNQSAATKILKLAVQKEFLKTINSLVIHSTDQTNNVVKLYVGKPLMRFVDDLTKSGAKRNSRDVLTRTNTVVPMRSLKDTLMSKLAPEEAAGVLVFALETKRFLLGKRIKPPHAGKYTMFGGKLRPDESPAEAAHRELLEEACMNAPLDSLVELSTYSSLDLRFHSFLVITRSENRFTLNDEFESAEWVPANRVFGVDLHPELRALFRNDPTLQRILAAPRADFDWEGLVDQIISGVSPDSDDIA